MQYAQRQLNLQFDAVWAPLFLLLAVYALLGAVSAWVGIKTGRRLVASPALSPDISSSQTSQKFQKKKNLDFDYSILWLIMNVLFLTGVFLLLGKINFGLWAILVAVVATTWAVRYKRALRQLVKPSLWIFFVLITMITAFVFTRLQSDSLTFADALLIGVEMNLRAIILIMGFSVLGTELYHPAIREFLAKSYFKQLPPALELSLESLPSMISTVPDLKTILKNPVQVIHQLMAHAEIRIVEIRQRFENTPCVFIITGDIGSGKTTCIKNLVTKLKSKNVSVGGFYSLRITENEITTGYNIVNIPTGEEQPFLRLDGRESQEKIGRFFIYPEGLKLGKDSLHRNSFIHSKLIVIDEIGKLELQGGGWAERLGNLTRLSQCPVLLSVRKEVVYDVIQKWNLNPHFIFEISENNCEEFYDLLIQHLSRTSV
jgi:nucleoside-triphosphatase THEP1